VVLHQLVDVVSQLHEDVARPPEPVAVAGELLTPDDAARVLGIGGRVLWAMLAQTAQRGGMPTIVDVSPPNAKRRRWRWRSDADVRAWADAVWGLGRPAPKAAKARRSTTPEPPRKADGSIDFRALIAGK
jgi:hypothetical protein